jgi:hypothetical protein
MTIEFSPRVIISILFIAGLLFNYLYLIPKSVSVFSEEKISGVGFLKALHIFLSMLVACILIVCATSYACVYVSAVFQQNTWFPILVHATK